MPGKLLVTFAAFTLLAAGTTATFDVQPELAENEGGQLLELIRQGLPTEDGRALEATWERESQDLLAGLAALPAGRLAPGAARYALHRLLLQRRGWVLKGLDPQGRSWTGPSHVRLLEKALPTGLQKSLEAELAKGLDATDVAALAMLIEHVVRKVEAVRFRAVCNISQVCRPSVRASAAHYIMSLYAVSYVLGQDPSVTNHTDLKGNLQVMDEIYPNWPRVKKVLQEAVESQVHAGYVKMESLQNVAQVMVNDFRHWQEPACLSMKQGLMTMEDHGTGRVRLAEFYSKALHEGKWQLSESVPYLRLLGALDESNSRNPRVIIPNYVYGASNCLATSSYLSVCCVSECEALLGHLERELGKPEASPEVVAELVAAQPSSTVAANRSLSTVMLHRLNRIAAEHGGSVPLHGRLFAQWLHHAYPRECPYPHLSGQTQPLQAEDWMRVTGQDVSASASAMAEHAGLKPSKSPKKRGPVESVAWSYEEELFVPPQPVEPTGLLALHGAVYMAALAVMAFGFTLVKMARGGRLAARASQSAEQKDPGMGGKMFMV